MQPRDAGRVGRARAQRGGGERAEKRPPQRVPAERRTVGRGVPSHVRRTKMREEEGEWKEPMMEEQRAAPGEEEEVTDNVNYQFRHVGISQQQLCTVAV